MTMLAQEAVESAFVARLQAWPALAGLLIIAAGDEPIPEGVDRAVVVAVVHSEPSAGEILGRPIDWTSAVVVQCTARATSDLDKPWNALLMQAHAALSVDATLAGAVGDIGDPTLTWERDERDTAIGTLTATYPVQHRTAYRSIGV